MSKGPDSSDYYSWDLNLMPKETDSRPDYHQWDQSGQSKVKKSPVKKSPIRRTKSDCSDRYTMATAGKRGGKRPSKEAEDILRREEESEEEESSDEEEEEEEEDEKTMGFNWKTKKRMLLRSRSDLTGFQSNTVRKSKKQEVRRKSRLPPKRTVSFSSAEPAFVTLPPLREEDKPLMFWTKAEVQSFRYDRDEEKAEKERQRRNSQFANNTAGMDSLWGSSSKPKKKPDKSAEEEARKAREAKEEADMQSVMDSLALAMAQAQMVTGY
ncbi:expressed unknown protein [Seminavis robusta]|uniref:Uncharacterized protein n=1 Tax=Seminavis robusta TaxID=568900 RepID=A0A9N8F085_9STRA|nr:expressed unknown protein [Seminavis robusta]|eukprot:Sro2117_g315280.1 n/a (268) ;mRNA; r:15583-16386